MNGAVLGANGLLSVRNLQNKELLDFFQLLDQASPTTTKEVGKTPIGLLGFFEPSTRTRLSFESAGKHLGIHWICLATDDLSLKKGESLKDSFEVINSYEIDFYVLRHSEELFAERVQAWTQKPVFNAGDGTNEHPTQALGDAYSLWKLDPKKKWTICFYGDFSKNRVAHSDAILFRQMGYEVALLENDSGGEDAWKNSLQIPSISLDQMKDFDVVYVLRTQKERGGKTSLAPLNAKQMGENSYLMHAGPVIHGEDLSAELGDFSRKKTLIMEQVQNCYRLRKQLLFHCLSQ